MTRVAPNTFEPVGSPDAFQVPVRIAVGTLPQAIEFSAQDQTAEPNLGSFIGVRAALEPMYGTSVRKLKRAMNP